MCKEKLRVKYYILLDQGRIVFSFFRIQYVVINFILGGEYIISLYIDCSYFLRGRIKFIVFGFYRSLKYKLYFNEID